jgi:hypothetical protein
VGVVCRFWLTGYQIPVKESRLVFLGYYLGLVLILFIFFLGDWILEEGFFLLFFGELMGLID